MQRRIASPIRLVSKSSAVFCSVLVFSALAVSPAAAEDDLADLSLEALMDIEVTSVSKKAQSRNDAPAAITVITNEDIRRSGLTTVPELLRLVPGVQVARVDANRWAISARGFNSSFSNKLLVMIDGRSVYTPLFGGTYWDIQDYPLEDIDRIEVIRGPGGTLWGANAVNGIINVITKNAANTQGGLLSGYGGNYQYGGTGRWGGQVGEKVDYRVYARGFKNDDFDVDKAKDGQDEWRNIRGGFRVDSTPTDQDTVTVSGDYYDVEFDQGQLSLAPLGYNKRTYHAKGGDILAKWSHAFSDETGLAAKAYYARDYRDAEVEEDRNTYDVELQLDHALPQDSLGLDETLSFSMGGNYRASVDDIDGNASTGFDPSDDTIHLVDFFLQGQIDLFDRVAVIAGSKLGWNSMSDFEYQPSVRVIGRIAEGHNVWGAVSRAVRLPTRSDQDLASVVGGIPISGDKSIDSEELLSFELGYRFFALERFTADISGYYNEYETLAVLLANPNPPGGLIFGDGSKADAWGFEVELNFMPTDWWRLTAGYAYVDIDSDPQSGAVAFATDVADASPKNEVKLRSHIDLPYDVEFDAFFQWVDELKQVTPSAPIRNEVVDDIYRLDLRLGWKPLDWLELSFAAQNILDRRHYEYADTAFNEATQVPRTYYGKATVTF